MRKLNKDMLVKCIFSENSMDQRFKAWKKLHFLLNIKVYYLQIMSFYQLFNIFYFVVFYCFFKEWICLFKHNYNCISLISWLFTVFQSYSASGPILLGRLLTVISTMAISPNFDSLYRSFIEMIKIRSFLNLKYEESSHNIN